MSAVDELVAWLRQQLDEDERVAREATAENDGEASWPIEPPDPAEPWARPRLLWLAVQDSTDPSTMPPAMAEHIARWDPARVLAEAEAKRRVLDRWAALRSDVSDALNRDEPDEAPVVTEAAFEDVVLMLAQPYAGRPGWREEWAA